MKAAQRPNKHGILLAPVGFSVGTATKPRYASIKWKQRAIQTMRMRFYFQVLKANVKLKQKWWNNYSIQRIGAPGIGEFLCHETFYVAAMSLPSDAVKFRQYWYWCRRKSFEILLWLWELETDEYSWKLHLHLKGLLVTKRPILSEVERYESKETTEITLQVFRDWSAAIYRGTNEEKIRPL